MMANAWVRILTILHPFFLSTLNVQRALLQQHEAEMAELRLHIESDQQKMQVATIISVTVGIACNMLQHQIHATERG